jgi:hypothetical protein
VNALIAKAMEGDIAAIKEIADRVDGKVPQQMQGDPDAPLVVGRIERVIVDPKVIEHEDEQPLKLVKGREQYQQRFLAVSTAKARWSIP